MPTPPVRAVQPTALTGRPRRRDDRGSVTAETAAVLPVLVLVALALTWVMSVGIAQIRVVDAAREGARLVARGEPVAAATAHALRSAPAETALRVRHDGPDVVVEAQARVRGPGRLLRMLPGVVVRARSVAAREPR